MMWSRRWTASRHTTRNNMQIEIIDRFPAELDEIAQHSPEATFYQSSTWVESLSLAFDAFEPHCVVAREGRNTLGYLPYFVVRRAIGRQLWSMPFGTYGGPVARGSAEVGAALVDHFVGLRGEGGGVELGLVDFTGKVSSAHLGFEREATQIVRLPADFDDLWGRFDKSKRRQARKAERDGVSVRQARGVDDFRTYYKIYADRCRAWRQTLVYPLELFEALAESGSDSVRLFVAEDAGTIVGGHLNFYFGESVIAWNGVTADHSRASQASTLLYSTCLRHACENGYKRYNLGASLGKGTLEDYKKALGGERHAYRTGRWRSLRGRITSAIVRAVRRAR